MSEGGLIPPERPSLMSEGGLIPPERKTQKA